jgi:hypothetical protein
LPGLICLVDSVQVGLTYAPASGAVLGLVDVTLVRPGAAGIGAAALAEIYAISGSLHAEFGAGPLIRLQLLPWLRVYAALFINLTGSGRGSLPLVGVEVIPGYIFSRE